jgi:hypothetical protein
MKLSLFHLFIGKLNYVLKTIELQGRNQALYFINSVKLKGNKTNGINGTMSVTRTPFSKQIFPKNVVNDVFPEQRFPKQRFPERP